MEDTFNFQGYLTYIVYIYTDLRIKTSFMLEFMIHCNKEGETKF